MRIKYGVSMAVGLSVFLAAGFCTAEMQWDAGDGTLALERDGVTVWRFNYGRDLSKPYFHPVSVPDVGVLTWEDPADHPWHHALWFSWKYINTVNYWEEDRRTGRSAGTTRIVSADVTQGTDFNAEFRLELEYGPAREAAVLKEERTIVVSPPAADGSYHMDWTCAFTAISDALLDRTPVPPDQWNTAPGGYAGLSVRFAEDLFDCEVTDSDGAITEQKSRIRVKSRAVDYAGTIDGKAAGIAILDHPDNLNAPSPWYIINTGNDGMRFFSPAVIHNGAHLVEAGESLTLRYRVLVHPGKLDAVALRAAVEDFTRE